MAVNNAEQITGTKKEFLDLFHKLCYSRQSWQVWSDLMTVMACSISNAVDKTTAHWEQREKEYLRAIKDLGGVEIPSKLFSVVVMALERNPDQDFLGGLYMELNLGSHWHAQFFTPYSICELMAQTQMEDVNERIDKNGYISIADPSCGAGATLVAAAGVAKRARGDFQNRVLFVGQDIDSVAAKMCYIQLSLLGCAGYICVANTLTNPLTGHVLFPKENKGQELWFTPMFASDIWNGRRTAAQMDMLIRSSGTRKKTEKYTFFFNFDKEEQYERITEQSERKVAG